MMKEKNYWYAFLIGAAIIVISLINACLHLVKESHKEMYTVTAKYQKHDKNYIILTRDADSTMVDTVIVNDNEYARVNIGNEVDFYNVK